MSGRLAARRAIDGYTAGPMSALFVDYMNYGALAFVVTVFATPLAAWAARRMGVMDMPDQRLKPHARPIPYLGGLAIMVGWATAAIAGAYVIPGIMQRTTLGIVAGGVAISTLGLADDMFSLPPKVRLLGSGLVIAAVMWATGTGAELLEAPLGWLGLPAAQWLTTPLSIVVGLLLVMGACNSANLIDGLDGLCAGVTAIISIGFFVLAAHLAYTVPERGANEVRLLLTMAMLGATLGFLPMNFNPAKIFMGDAGSMLLGYNCGMIILLFAEYGLVKWVLCGLMVFALPMFDTALAIVRRWRNGRPIFEGDRSHFYDQLVDRGLSVRKVVAISYALAAGYALLGVLPALVGMRLRVRHLAPLYAGVVAVTIVIIVAAKMVRVDPVSQTANRQG